MEITEAEQKKRIKRNQESLRELRDNIKCTSIHIIGGPEGEEGEKGGVNIFEEKIAKISLTWERTQTSQSRKHRVPPRINPKRTTQTHIVIKMVKIKDKERILKII